MNAEDLRKDYFWRANGDTCDVIHFCGTLRINMDDTREKLKKLDIRIRELADRL